MRMISTPSAKPSAARALSEVVTQSVHSSPSGLVSCLGSLTSASYATAGFVVASCFMAAEILSDTLSNEDLQTVIGHVLADLHDIRQAVARIEDKIAHYEERLSGGTVGRFLAGRRQT